MAYDFTPNAHFYIPRAVVTAVPLTMSCLFNADSLASSGVLMSILDEGSVNFTGFHIAAAGAAAGDPVRAVASNAGSFAIASTSVGYSTGVWQHACGVFSANNSRTAYLNAGSAGTDTTALTPATIMDSTVVGASRNGGVGGNGFDGRIAEPAIWNVALTVDEIAALAKGVSPLKIRPQSLVFYPPLIRELVELKGGVSLTASGAPTVAVHPRVYGT